MIRSAARLVLVVTPRRGDRRALFDVLEGLGVGEILSAGDAARAQALLRHGRTPVLAILDFAHAPEQARKLCARLAGVPVIGLLGAGADHHDGADLAAGAEVLAWLPSPVDTEGARVRIREMLDGAGSRPRLMANADAAGKQSDAQPPVDAIGNLRVLAELLQPDRDAHGMSSLARRALDALAMDLIVVAVRTGTDEPPGPLVCLDRTGAPGAFDLLRHEVVQQALDGAAVICAGDPLPDSGCDDFARAAGCVRYAVLPLLDAQRKVLGVMVCGVRHADAASAPTWQASLEIVASRFAALLEVRAERERGRSRALFDALTGLPNRMLFNDRLHSALREARRTGEVFAVLFVDLDRFKGINDSLGHGIGDQVLVAEAARLRDLLRASDTVARYAGDEFTAILRHVGDRGDITRTAGKLLEGMQAPLILADGSELQVTASVGVSIYPDDGGDAEALIRHADLAMYSAKAQGRNHVRAFGSVTGESRRQPLELAARLRNAEANGELRVVYQPQVALATEEVVGVEAQLRWRHPELGVLGPGFFVPLAEETGLILPIGDWMLRQACRDLASCRARADAPLRLALSLSALQWMQPNLLAMIEAACHHAGMEPGMLDLAVSGSLLGPPPSELAATLRALRRVGCRIVVDDGGVTERSAAEGIARLPIDAFKIERGYVRNIGSDPDDEAEMTGLLEVARRQHRRVLADGVETERQLEFLRERGCSMAQGDLFCRPMEAAGLAALLRARDASANDDGDNTMLTGSAEPLPQVVPLPTRRTPEPPVATDGS